MWVYLSENSITDITVKFKSSLFITAWDRGFIPHHNTLFPSDTAELSLTVTNNIQWIFNVPFWWNIDCFIQRGRGVYIHHAFSYESEDSHLLCCFPGALMYVRMGQVAGLEGGGEQEGAEWRWRGETDPIWSRGAGISGTSPGCWPRALKGWALAPIWLILLSCWRAEQRARMRGPKIARCGPQLWRNCSDFRSQLIYHRISFDSLLLGI